MYGWRYILARITWSPLVILPPLFAVLAAITFAARWGGVGFVAGLPVGLAIGLGAAYIWYRFITSKTVERDHDGSLLDQLMNRSRATNQTRRKIRAISSRKSSVPSKSR